MKAIDISCSSQASSTTISLTMDEPSSSSSIQLSRSPAIDRHNPIIRDSRRSPIIPPSTHPPPRVPTKSHSNKSHPKKKKSNILNNINNHKNAKKKADADEDDDDDDIINVKISTNVRRNNWSFTKPCGDFISPPGSTRYLLSEKVLFDDLSDFGPARKIFPHENPKPENVKTNESCDVAKSTSSVGSEDQVVVLRVSLHCRGCERKMRKHISRMEGVTSFNIDFAAKKVTVTGKITPLEVLSSISKVKNAQLWPPTISSSLSPELSPMTSCNSELKSHHEYSAVGA